MTQLFTALHFCSICLCARSLELVRPPRPSHCVRYPNGESRADVAQRVTLFTSKFFRGSKQHHVVFLHGVTQRAMRMTFFNRTVEWFEREPNPANGSVVHMKRNIDQSDGPRWSEYYLYKGEGQFHAPAVTAPADVDSD